MHKERNPDLNYLKGLGLFTAKELRYCILYLATVFNIKIAAPLKEATA